MPIEFRCSQCNQLLRVPDDSAGKSARCPKCQALMTVPAAADANLPFALVQPLAGSPPPPKPPPDNPFGDYASASPFAAPAAGGLNPYASPAGAAYAFEQAIPPGSRPGLPWEASGQSLGTWWETAKLCLMQPSYAFDVMRPYGGMGQPMLYCGLGLLLGTVGQMLWYLPLIVLIGLAANQGRNGGDVAAMVGIQFATQLFSGAVGVVLGATIGLMIGAAIAHVCLLAVGGARQGYETTLRVIGYANGSTAWLNVIPCVGGLIAFVWFIVLEIIGFSRAHQIDTGKAALAVFLPLIVCAGCIAAMIGLAFAGGAFR
jgi:phage FluMu protein Com